MSSVANYFPSVPEHPSMDTVKNVGTIDIGFGTGSISVSGSLTAGGSVFSNSQIALGIGGSMVAAKIAHYYLSSMFGSNDEMSG